MQLPTDTDARTWAVRLAIALVVVPFVVFAVPQVVGADHSYVVQSDSMTPTFAAGDVVVVDGRSPSTVEAGDVITYTAPGASVVGGGGANRITHRVVEVVERDGGRFFRTKGDANEEADGELVPASNLVGVVTFSIPYIGWVIAFGQTRLGTLLLVVAPLALLALTELWTVAGGLGLTGEDDDGTAGDGEAP
ncbi:signal peptidase, endoplasmic reticulum-type [Halogeometricum rufum]|uniref:Signal peptidase I n=1 Tax=Halogeometricum rufum TaxID=553469 RepID=A0A1I6H048_9EURY|nr:signal peptidase I [Halogeometricum rufum]SFR47818.1 signal peptidase, endoplasmic reticulum-type [Halogeometricum rufum]